MGDHSEIPISLAYSQASGTGSLFPWLNEPAEEFPLHPKRLFETWKRYFSKKVAPEDRAHSQSNSNKQTLGIKVQRAREGQPIIGAHRYYGKRR